ncbi:MAG: glycosyltransferase family 39 protein, partial [Gemmatimonadaceae bacterium]|nr:glycosyltransferase family 39 protein [Chitinophagaceae bacterium]
MEFLRKNAVNLFFGIWLVINLMQASATELFDDEAYYWLYSKFLDWGYYDHPPMIALVIKAGYGLFQNEFGLRLIIAVMSTATLAIIYRLLPSKNDGLFFAIACSMGLLQLGGIIAVPDIPLGFFVALFFLWYKRFIRKSSLVNGLLLGLAMALMLYSKYHGVLIIFFTFASNLSLVKKPGAWLAAIFGALLFAPHLLWQYAHDWPSIHFHLFERNASEYSFSFTIEYLIGQILLAGPLMGWLLLWKSFFYKSGDLFERALKFCL